MKYCNGFVFVNEVQNLLRDTGCPGCRLSNMETHGQNKKALLLCPRTFWVGTADEAQQVPIVYSKPLRHPGIPRLYSWNLIASGGVFTSIAGTWCGCWLMSSETVALNSHTGCSMWSRFPCGNHMRAGFPKMSLFRSRSWKVFCYFLKLKLGV